MKYLFEIGTNGVPDWNQPLVDCEDDFDERPPTDEQIEMLKRLAEQEESATSIRC